MSITETPALDVTVHQLVRKPVAVVAAHAGSPVTTSQWFPHLLGRRVPLGFDVVEYDAEHGMVLRTGQGRIQLEATYTWEPAGTWTRVTLRTRGDAPKVGLAGSLLGRAAGKGMRNDLERLVTLIEATA